MVRHRTTFLLTFLVCVIQVCCISSEHNLKHRQNAGDLYKRVETYSVDWFLKQIRGDVLDRYKNADDDAPFYNKLFYTRNMSKIAKDYACNESLITIWEPWKPALYNDSDLEAYPFSYIHHNDTSRNIFFKHISEASATLATGFVHVMHNPADYKEPPMNGIWGQIEAKTLEKRVCIDKISKLSGIDKSTIRAIFDRVSGWLEDSVDTAIGRLPTRPSEQMELKSKLRRSGFAQIQMKEDAKMAGRHCSRLPEYTLHVDW